MTALNYFDKLCYRVNQVMNVLFFFQKRPLAKRVLIFILLFGSFFTLLTIIFQLYLDYNRDLSEINKRIRQIKLSYVASLTRSLWALDDEQINIQMQGILALPDIEYLEIKTLENEIYTKGTLPEFNALIRHSFPLIYQEQQLQVPLGFLNIVISLEGIYRRLQDRIVVIIFTQTVKTFLLSFFILFIFQYLVTKHLTKMAQYARELSLNNLHVPLILERPRRLASSQDELEQVVSAINDMRLSLIKDKITIRENENRLTQFLEAVPIGIFVVDAQEQQPYYLNRTAQQILGKGIIFDTLPERLPAIYQVYLAGTEQVYPVPDQPLLRALQGEKSHIDDMEVHQDTRIIPIEAWGTPIFNEQDEIIYAIAAFQDITERKQREQAQRAREAAEAVNRALMDSIQYAKLIQASLLPNLTQIKTYLPNSFFLWQPRDVIGGDMFYSEAFADGFIIAVMDCTGHGVPGAFMTMIATTHLKRIINDEGCHEPALILKRLNFLVKTTLQQETEYARSDDGLEAAICQIKPQAKQLIFAGARLPLYYFEQGELQIIKGDKQSLGYKRSNLDFTFTTHTLGLEESSHSFYLFTDGVIDQLGGEKRLPFGKKRFQNLLRTIHTLNFEQQSEHLLTVFDDYKGENERQDDLTIVGFSC